MQECTHSTSVHTAHREPVQCVCLKRKLQDLGMFSLVSTGSPPSSNYQNVFQNFRKAVEVVVVLHCVLLTDIY
jgi:hypothetical protein